VNKNLTAPLSREASGEDLLRRPEMTYEQLVQLAPFVPGLSDEQAAEQVEIQVKYEGISRVSRMKLKNSSVTRIRCYLHRWITVRSAACRMK
jgi:tRNA uridine 5-carboxymethylaminomethyl modification enzyme